MKAIQITKPGTAELVEIPEPVPGSGELLLDIEGVSTCPQWDFHILDGSPMFPGQQLKYPYVAGQPAHEAVCRVVKCGPGATLKPGARVVTWRDAGHNRQGFYAERNTAREENLLQVPDPLPIQALAPFELAMCVQVAFDKLALLKAIEGKRVGVSGLGPSGLIAVQMAKAYGAKEVIGLDPVAARHPAALTLGATSCLAPCEADWQAARYDARALDAAIDCTGFKAAIEFLMDRTRHAVALFGVVREDLVFGPSHRGGLSLLGYDSHNVEAARRALALVLDGRLQLAPLVTKTLPLSQYLDGIALLRAKQATKICYVPG